MTLEQFRRALYKTQRGIGDYQALKSGGVPKLTRRVVRRTVTRKVVGPMWSRLWR